MRKLCRSRWRRNRALRFDQLNHQPFDDSPDLIELRTAAPLFVFRVFRFLKVLTYSQTPSGQDQCRAPQNDPPIDCQVLQRFELRTTAGPNTLPSVSRASSQSFRNPSSPRPVSGCLKSCSNAFNDNVPVCASIRAAGPMCNGIPSPVAASRKNFILRFLHKQNRDDRCGEGTATFKLPDPLRDFAACRFRGPRLPRRRRPSLGRRPPACLWR